jgi:hypothetical protein
MSGPTALRLAALIAIGWGLWVLAGGPLHFGAGTAGVSLSLRFSHALAWLVGGIAVVIGCALWMRQAWAWWLGLAAALFELWRLLWPIFSRGGAPRWPGATTLLSIALLIAFVALLFVPKARAACSR